MEDLANEFSSYAMIEDIGSSAPCGLQLSKKSDPTDDQASKKHGSQHFQYKSKLSYSVNLSPNVSNSMSMSQISKNQPKSSRHRYSTRSSSILLKSNSLALSDSESTLSDDTKGQSSGGTFFNERRQRVKKSKRKKPDKDVQIYPPYIPTISNDDQYIYGKRKRSTTISQNSYESNSTQMSRQCDLNKTNKLTKYNCQNENKMDCDDDAQEDSTSLSEESNLSDPRFEADDEQSDYYEVSSSLQKKNRQYGRTSSEKTSSFGIVNPFSMLSSTSPSTSSTIWKRRRKTNLPNNHFN